MEQGASRFAGGWLPAALPCHAVESSRLRQVRGHGEHAAKYHSDAEHKAHHQFEDRWSTLPHELSPNAWLGSRNSRGSRLCRDSSADAVKIKGERRDVCRSHPVPEPGYGCRDHHKHECGIGQEYSGNELAVSFEVFTQRAALRKLTQDSAAHSLNETGRKPSTPDQSLGIFGSLAHLRHRSRVTREPAIPLATSLENGVHPFTADKGQDEQA